VSANIFQSTSVQKDAGDEITWCYGDARSGGEVTCRQIAEPHPYTAAGLLQTHSVFLLIRTVR
jgi:hypothetical protein